jgi:predicted ATPase
MRRDLPAGTVTFVFTDIEGSTRLLERLGDRYPEALAEHRRVVRSAFAAHRGVEVDTQGDAFLYAFARASDAVAASGEAQSALAPGPVRVRIGVHTGEPQLTDEGYVGLDLHRGARIAAAAHGGQVVVSQSTRDLVDANLRDLGLHRLEDLSAPMRLYQLGDRHFPPLQTLHGTNLPVPVTAFLGRETELGGLVDLLGRRDVRLVTLTGAGGTGKTRLALQAAAESAEEYPDGVVWVSLAPVRDPQLVSATIAAELGAREELSSHLADRRLLLLLDNFEHVIGAAAELAGLIASCPNIDLLVTSREPLHVSGEWTFAVPPLADDDATGLFRERALAVDSGFAETDEVGLICRRLDGLPLAIELAAARVNVLSPRAILERLDARLPLLTGGAHDVPERQRTLRATIEWSYDLLDDYERRLFARLSVFAGGATLEAAEQVCDADLDTLASLVDKSLLRRRGDRYWMLETIREYAATRLGRDDEDGCRQRHAAYYRLLVEHDDLRLDRREAARVEAEYDNVRVALDWARRTGDDELLVALVGALEEFWTRVGRSREALSWLEEALAASMPAYLRIRLSRSAGNMALFQGDAAAARRHASASGRLAAATGDEHGFLVHLNGLAAIAAAEGRADEARAHLEDARRLAVATGRRSDLALTLSNLAAQALADEDWAAALGFSEESIAIIRELGRADTFGAVNARVNGSLAAFRLGRLDEALRLGCEALEVATRLGWSLGTLYGLLAIAAVSAATGAGEEAAALLAALDAHRDRLELVLEPAEQGWYEETVARVERATDSDARAAARERGVALTLDDAARRALGDAKRLSCVGGDTA